MSAEIIPFPYNDVPQSAEQRARLGFPSPLQEATAIVEAATRYRLATDTRERTQALHQMSRIREHGSPRARLAVECWRDEVLGPPPATKD